jgi:predicted dehydrogenase
MTDPSRCSSRRRFLAQSATVSAAALTAFGAPAVQARGANETLRVGLIGAGVRSRALVNALLRIPNVSLAAVSDVYDVRLDEAASKADPKAFRTKNFPDLLDRKDIDAVVIASPDHWHVPMTVAACEAGKDVYVEKPLTHTLEEGRTVIDAQNKHNRIVQVGMQQRSMPQMAKGKELFDAGRLGKVVKVHLTWNRNSRLSMKPRADIKPSQVDWKAFLGNAPDQPFDPYKVVQSWRWFWDFGGGVFTDLMVHHVDIANWILDLDHPEKATSIGSFNAPDSIWQTPDTVQTLQVHPGGLQVYFEGTFSNARNAAMIEIMGTDATLYLDRGRCELHPEPRHKGEPVEMVLGSGNKGRDFYDKPDGELLHLTNWVECIRSRQKPHAPAEAGVKAAAAAHLANRALRSGEVVSWKN